MSGIAVADRASKPDFHGGGGATALAAADWLAYAATPVFALMSLLTGALNVGQADILCSAVHGAARFGGMLPMYGLMSAFHAAPWVKLIVGRGLPPASAKPVAIDLPEAAASAGCECRLPAQIERFSG